MAALRVDPSDPSSFEDMRDFLDKLMEGIDFQLDEVRAFVPTTVARHCFST